MATYAFETITAEQALNIQPTDIVTFAGGPANRASVVYQSYDPAALTAEVPSILVTIGGRTVKFDTNLVRVSDAGGLQFADGSVLVVGDTGDERASGGDGHDGLYGGPAADTVAGGKGDDLLQGNAGDDALDAGSGTNTVYGGKGDDEIVAARDTDRTGSFAHGNQGNDDIVGGGGADTLLGGQGDDFLGGGDGDDYLSGDLGADELHGGDGADTLIGGEGDDTIQSGGGADRVLAGAGDDQVAIFYGGGAIVDGGAGNDTITSASVGKDVLSGGEGRDLFVFVAKNDPAQGQDDVILDWNAVDDRIQFDQVSIYTILPRSYSEFVATDYAEATRIAQEHIMFTGAQYVAAQVGADVVIFADTNADSSDGADISLVLAGRTLADISLASFV
ncbi:calcium-binding protein [Phenylobacterium sp.]|uniref:calcium-binding protein n=1 Tax=Phenylobacterium sp. TaxID=1871053 RepID=UPI003784830A